MEARSQLRHGPTGMGLVDYSMGNTTAAMLSVAAAAQPCGYSNAGFALLPGAEHFFDFSFLVFAPRQVVLAGLQVFQ